MVTTRCSHRFNRKRPRFAKRWAGDLCANPQLARRNLKSQENSLDIANVSAPASVSINLVITA